MKLEKQVISLELAKRLKELGVKQESYAYWVEQDFGGGFPLHTRGFCTGGVSAFTVAELGLLLAEGLEGSWQGGGLIWRCKYTEVPGEKIPVTEADTEADARAKMLIYLLENKLIETDNHETV